MREWLSDFNPFNSWKVLAWANHIQAILDEQFLPPVVVNWDLRLGCCYDCPHCIWGKRKQLPHFNVPLEFIEKVPKFLHFWGVKGVCLAGERGDPCLHPDLVVALRLLHFWGIEIGLVTNGFAFNQYAAATYYCKFVGFSMDAGTPETYAKVHGTSRENFHIVLNHIERLCTYASSNRAPVEIGYKFLILPDSYETMEEAIKIARDIGVRDFQIRPANLPDSEKARIDPERLADLLDHALTFETKDFHVYTVRHKFTPELKRKPQEHCWATPLTSTWLASGEVVACVDLRDENYNTLCNYINDGLGEVKRVWGSPKHLAIIKEINNRLDNCKRCTNGGYNKIIANAFVKDNMDMRMI